MPCLPSQMPGFFDVFMQPAFLWVFVGLFGLGVSLCGWFGFARIRRAVPLVKQQRTLFRLERWGTVFGIPGLFFFFWSLQWWFALDQWHGALVSDACLRVPDAAAYGQAAPLCIVLIVLGVVFGVGGSALVGYSRIRMKRLARSIETP